MDTPLSVRAAPGGRTADLRRHQEASQRVHIYRTVGPPPSVEPEKGRLTRNSSSIPHATKDGSEVIEIHHATHALLALATLTPPSCVEVGTTAPPRPVPSAHHGDGSMQRSTRTAIEGCATTGAELHPAQRAHQSYGHRQPAPRHSRLPAGGPAACRLHLRGAQGRSRSAGHVEARDRRGAAPTLVRWIRERHAPMNAASTTHSWGCVHSAGHLPQLCPISEERTPCT